MLNSFSVIMSSNCSRNRSEELQAIAAAVAKVVVVAVVVVEAQRARDLTSPQGIVKRTRREERVLSYTRFLPAKKALFLWPSFF